MSLPAFDEVPPATMVLVARFSPPIDINMAAGLLPIYWLTPEELQRYFSSPPTHGKRARVPAVRPGAIISITRPPLAPGGRPEVRGLQLSDDPKAFPHAVTIDISSTDKGLTLKLCPQTVQFCGAKSVAQVEEIMRYLFWYFRQVQSHVEYLREHREEAQKAHDWLLDHVIEREGMPLLAPATVPSEIDRQSLTILWNHIPGTSTVEALREASKYLLTLEGFISESPRLDGPIEEPMVYRSIQRVAHDDRWNVARYIDGREGFTASYELSLCPSLIIQHPVQARMPNPSGRCKEDRDYIIRIYREGGIRITGPGGPEAREVYEKFRRLFTSLPLST